MKKTEAVIVTLLHKEQFDQVGMNASNATSKRKLFENEEQIRSNNFSLKSNWGLCKFC